MATILYAEDKSGIRESHKVFFQEAFSDYNIVIVKSGNALEKKLSKEIGNVKVVIADNDMPPGLKGSQIIAKYAQKKGFEQIPFILYYAGDKSTGEFLARKYNNVFYMPKPTDFQHFEKFIRDILKSPIQSSQ